MSQIKNRKWTRFQIDAEVDMFGTKRVVNEQNRMWYAIQNISRLLSSVKDGSITNEQMVEETSNIVRAYKAGK